MKFISIAVMLFLFVLVIAKQEEPDNIGNPLEIDLLHEDVSELERKMKDMIRNQPKHDIWANHERAMAEHRRALAAMPQPESIPPPADITESGTEYKVSIQLPEKISREQIAVKVVDGFLRITGSEKHHSEKNSHGQKRVDSSSDAFDQRYSVPSSVDPKQINIAFERGQLVVTLKKIEKASA